MIGYSITVHRPWEPEGQFYFRLGVDEAKHRQGMGQQLYEDGLRFIESHNGMIVTSEVRDDDSDGQRFAEQRGLTVTHHTCASKLAPENFPQMRSIMRRASD